MSAVTVLGLGAMGSRIAARLGEAGHEVTVWNRSPERADRLAATSSVTVAATATEAVRSADVVLSMVADDAASRSLWLAPDGGVLSSLHHDAVAVEASTISPELARRLGEAAADAGRAFIEAPVVGSRPQADAGALLVLAGGEPDVVDRARPVLDAFGSAVRHVGPIGAAATVKLAVNGLFGVQVAAYAEAVGLLRRSDVDHDAALGLLGSLPITSPGLQRILGLFASGDYAPNFPLPLVAKDFGYLVRLADGLGAPTPMAEAAAAVYDAAAEEHADLDIAGVATRYLAG